ncbi:hypothetical protein GF377_08120 [candidate division GN15 bacterium]|nr:hypothetical protein [candidate division GN15 bacterium]
MAKLVLYVAFVLLVAMFSFFPFGAFMSKDRRNPAAKIGLPALVVDNRQQDRRTVTFVVRQGRHYDDFIPVTAGDPLQVQLDRPAS